MIKRKKYSIFKNDLFGLSEEQKIELLNDFVIEPDKYAYSFSIKEKNKIRDMVTYNKGIEFGETLREIHYEIAGKFQENFCNRNENSFAYHKKIGCRDAIESHLKSNYFIKIDIHHFFESITEDLFFKIYGERFNNKWTNLLKGCFYKNSLCIGFVTSPIISDFFMSKFDNKITNYIQTNNKLHYSRYSDDILISSEENNDESLNRLFHIIKEELEILELRINDKKTKRVKLDLESHNSISFLGLNISKQDEINNKVTISKRYILFLLDLIEKNTSKYNDSCKGLLDEINSRVAYLAYNSPISFNKFQKKHFNKFGVAYNFVPKKTLNRKVADLTDEIPDWDEYVEDFEINIHTKVVNENNKEVILRDSVQLVKYLGNDSEVIVPPFVDSIGKNAFKSNKNIRKVILNNNIRSIGDSAFEWCTNLAEIELPKALQYIGDKAFSGCRKLKTINIPERVKCINSSAFSFSGLERIDFSEGLKTIKQEAFLECKNLEIIVLPLTLEEMEKKVFFGCTLLKNIIFSDKLLSIPKGCFKGCSSLENIYFTESILSIEEEAFSYCSLLKEVNIPKNIININPNSFSNCNNLLRLSVDLDNKVYDSRNNCNAIIETKTNTLLIVTPNSVLEDGIEVIGDNVYMGSNITSIHLPDSVKKIGNNAFRNCSLLKDIKTSKNITEIGESAFEGCISLKEIEIPDKVDMIKKSTFAGCERLTNIKLSKSITLIGEKAFENNVILKDITIPESTREIGYKAFANCYSLKQIKIPAATTNIMPYAFSACSKNLDKIVVDKMNTTYDSRNNCNAIVKTKTNEIILGCKNSNVEESILSIGEFAFAYCRNLEKIYMPDSLTKIEDKAFIDCSSLKIVNLNKVNKLGKEAFKDCKLLEKADLPHSLVRIEANCFSNCEALKEIVIPESIVYIGYKAFSGCRGLKSIFIPKNYTEFSETLFSECNQIEQIIVDKDNPIYDSREICNAVIKKEKDGRGILIFGCNKTIIPRTIDTISNRAFAGCRYLEYIEIPNNIKVIGAEAFAGCKALKEIKLPNSNIILNEGIFLDCESLDNVRIPSKITAIPYAMFSGCSSLKNIKLHEKVRNIYNNAFEGTNLKTFIVPKGVKYISQYTFRNCINLEEIYIHDKVKGISAGAFLDCINLKNVTIPQKLAYIGKEAFKNNRALEKIELPKKMKRISSGLFSGCESIKEITLPEVIEEIGSNAFYNCKALKNINLPDSIKVIEKRAFSNCQALKNINLPNNLDCIECEAFANNPLIEEINIPASVISFDNSAFMNCNNIKSIIVEDGNEYMSSRNSNVIIDDVNNRLVLGCMNSIIPNGVKYIASSAFAYCEGLKEIELPETITSIGVFSFGNCINLKKIKFSNKLGKISRKAFYGCTSLQDIHIPSSVEIIGKEAFCKCSKSLEKISVDKDNYIYTSGEDSNSIIYKGTNTLILGCKNTNIEDYVENIEEYAFSNAEKIEDIKIPKSVKCINDYAFENCLSVKSIHIPSSVISLGKYAFSNCTNIEKITVDRDNPVYYGENNGNALIEINTNTLIKASRSTNIPEYVVSIYIDAFKDVKNLEYLYIPKLLQSDLHSRFINCNNLKTIIVDENNPIYDSRNNCNAIIKRRENKIVLGCKDTMIPENVNSIGKNAFVNCENLIKLHIPKSISLINISAFSGCNNLSEIVVDKQNKVYDSRENCNAIIATKSNKYVLGCKNTKLPENIIRKNLEENTYEKKLVFYPYICDMDKKDDEFMYEEYNSEEYYEYGYKLDGNDSHSSFVCIDDDDLPF